MTFDSHSPDLRHIGETAFTEVLSILLSLPATVRESPEQCDFPSARDCLTSSVFLTGHRLSGSVHLQLPVPFVAHAVSLLTGLHQDSPEACNLKEDTSGEIANMVAGRVAAQLATYGYPCTLSTPSVTLGVEIPAENQSGMDHGKTNLFCDGHWLSIELKCRYATS